MRSVALMALMLTCAALAAPSNLVKNGSFEDLKDGKPSDWTLAEGAQVTEENGKHFLRVTSDAPDKTISATQKINLDAAWTKLTLTARMRGKNIKTGQEQWHEPRITHFFADGAGEHVGDWPEAIRLREDSDWKESSVSVDVPSGAKTLEVRAGLINCQGQVDFDDLRLEAR